jgi:hypothetical protein
MTKDDILRMAREAGFSLKNFGEPPRPYIHVFGYGDTLERFAALVAAAAKEEMLMAGNDQWLEEARKAEREACADICDQHATCEGTAQLCAAAIRARGQA